LCTGQDLAAIKQKIEEVSSDSDLKYVWNSLALSHTSFELTSAPSLPGGAIRYGQNINSLAGMFIGLLVGIWLVNGNLVEKLNRKGSH